VTLITATKIHAQCHLSSPTMEYRNTPVWDKYRARKICHLLPEKCRQTRHRQAFVSSHHCYGNLCKTPSFLPNYRVQQHTCPEQMQSKKNMPAPPRKVPPNPPQASVLCFTATATESTHNAPFLSRKSNDITHPSQARAKHENSP